MCLLDNAATSEDTDAPVEAAIPGLDFSSDKTSSSSVIDISHSLPDTKSSIVVRRKPIYTKPVPRAFERAWAEGRETGSNLPSRPHENSTGLLGESPGQHYHIP